VERRLDRRRSEYGGWYYHKGSEGEKGRRNTVSLLIYTFKDTHFPISALIESRSRHPPPALERNFQMHEKIANVLINKNVD